MINFHLPDNKKQGDFTTTTTAHSAQAVVVCCFHIVSGYFPFGKSRGGGLNILLISLFSGSFCR